MEVKCEYCGSMIPDDSATCPNCGAPNENMNRAASGTPKTIAELEQWYRDQHLPPYETTRFFIGIDYKEPKAFGIYQEDDTFIVYKNKADGSRAVRYRGKDEDYAVNEIFLKLKSEILNQKEHQQNKRTSSRKTSSGSRSSSSRAAKYGFDKAWGKNVLQLFGIVAVVVGALLLLFRSLSGNFWFVIGAFLVFFLILLIGRKVFKGHKKAVLAGALAILVILLILTAVLGHQRFVPRYYWYQDIPYVWYDDGYYSYDFDRDQYTELEDDKVPADLRNEAGKYQVDGNDTKYGYTPDFKNSSYYDDSSWADSIDFSSDHDNDYSWDSDYDWDYSDTDWDSDW